MSVSTAICPAVQQLSAYSFGSTGNMLAAYSITLHPIYTMSMPRDQLTLFAVGIIFNLIDSYHAYFSL